MRFTETILETYTYGVKGGSCGWMEIDPRSTSDPHPHKPPETPSPPLPQISTPSPTARTYSPLN